MKFRLRNVIQAGAALLAAALLFGAGSPANASIVIVVSDTNGDANVVFGPSANGGPIGTATGTIGTYSFSATAKGTPLIGAAGTGTLDLTFAGSSGANTGTLTITAYQFGYTAPGSAASAASISSIGGTLGSPSVTSKAWYDPSNTGNASPLPAYSLPAGLTLLLNATFTASGFYGTNNGMTISPFSQPYAIIEQESMVFSASGQITSGDAQTTISSPAPAGLVLALTGMPCLAIGSWIRRRLKIA